MHIEGSPWLNFPEINGTISNHYSGLYRETPNCPTSCPKPEAKAKYTLKSTTTIEIVILYVNFSAFSLLHIAKIELFYYFIFV